MTLRYLDMNQHDALYTIARAYPGGLEALALRLSMSVNTLRNKVRPNIDTHYVSSEEESLIMEYCQETRMPNALMPLIAKNWRHGLVAFPAPQLEGLTEQDLTQSLVRAMKEFSDVASAVSTAMSDRRITVQELDTLEREAQEALAAIFELRERWRAHAGADKDGAGR